VAEAMPPKRNVLSPSALGRAADPHQLYAHQLASAAADDHFGSTAVLGGGLCPTRWCEVSRPWPIPPWDAPGGARSLGFETSPYEQERYDRSAPCWRTSAGQAPSRPSRDRGVRGAMTRRLRALFPDAKINAVEVNPVFARRCAPA